MKFIDNLAQKILDDHTHLNELVVILPSERAVKYLGNSLFKLNNGPLIAPEMLTIDRWIKSQFNDIIDPTRLLLVLFESYLQTEEGKGQSFESFLTWGSALIMACVSIGIIQAFAKDLEKEKDEASFEQA